MTALCSFPTALSRASLALALLSGCACAADEVGRIAFGSCARQHRPQPVWDAIVASRPHVFLFLGDNVYLNSTEADRIRQAYAHLGSRPGYRRLRSAVPVYATWDDHDYGRNDAGSEFPGKDVSKQAFLEFFNVPASSPIRRRSGVYDAHVHGSAGRRVQIIMLDTRYFRGPLKRGSRTVDCPRTRYVPNDDPSVTMLGEEQWQWLEEQLDRPAELRIIASSIQVIPDQHCFEKWANLPLERQRLFRAIGDSRANGVVFVSGDRHLAEISRLDVGEVAYPLFEITSSGLNSAGAGTGESNRYRTTPENFRGDNFGLVQVDWAEEPPSVSLQIRDVDGRIVLEERVALSDLSP